MYFDKEYEDTVKKEEQQMVKGMAIVASVALYTLGIIFYMLDPRDWKLSLILFSFPFLIGGLSVFFYILFNRIEGFVKRLIRKEEKK